MPLKNSDVWLITGCSTGFGRELAKILLDRGFRVAVTARNPRSIQDLTAGHKDNALALKLDVTNKADVADAVKQTERAFGSVDVLVNNAGYGYVGAVEESEEDEIRAMVETNFFGLSLLTQLVLPGMRQRRWGSIVNISSIGGWVGFPSVAYYNATKFAVEGLSDALSKEVAPLGIKVMVVEPGPFRTDWAGRSLKKSPHRIPDYDGTAGEFRAHIEGADGNQIGDPIRGCEAIIKALESDNPPLHLMLGRPALETARNKLDLLRRDLDTWEALTLSADYPEHQAKAAR